LIQSDDSSVLASFEAVPPYTRVLSIDKEIGGAPKPSVDEIKKYAEAVNLLRTSLVTVSQSFTTGKTNVVEEMHKGNISVYVSVLRNEYISVAFDYFSDPTIELATFISGSGVDGVITEFPATATRYLSKFKPRQGHERTIDIQNKDKADHLYLMQMQRVHAQI